MARKSGWRGENGEDRNVGLETDRGRSPCRVCAGYRGNRGLHENLWLRQANGVSSEQCQLSAQARYQECVRYPTKAGRGRLASTIEHFWLEPELDRSAVAVLFGMPYRVRSGGQSYIVTEQTNAEEKVKDALFSKLGFAGLVLIALGTSLQIVGTWVSP